MKYSAITALFATLVAAQTIEDLAKSIPQCALACIREAEKAAGCTEGDFVCSCEKIDEITPGATTCVLALTGDAACTGDEIGEVSTTVANICALVSAGASQSPSPGVSVTTTATATDTKTAGTKTVTDMTTTQSVTSTTTKNVASTTTRAAPTTSSPGAAPKMNGASWVGAAAALAAFAL